MDEAWSPAPGLLALNTFREQQVISCFPACTAQMFHILNKSSSMYYTLITYRKSWVSLSIKLEYSRTHMGICEALRTVYMVSIVMLLNTWCSIFTTITVVLSLACIYCSLKIALPTSNLCHHNPSQCTLSDRFEAHILVQRSLGLIFYSIKSKACSQSPSNDSRFIFYPTPLLFVLNQATTLLYTTVLLNMWYLSSVWRIFANSHLKFIPSLKS